MYLRYYLDPIAAKVGADPAAFRSAAELLMMLVAAAGGALLLALSRQPWAELGAMQQEAPEGAEPSLARQG
jgi:hypothetical protein